MKKVNLFAVVGVALPLIFIGAVYDSIAVAHFNAHRTACRSTLGQLYEKLKSFRQDHSVSPGTLSVFCTGQICSCYESEVPFTYRYVKHPEGSSLVCWDTIPHIPHHPLFIWKNYPQRNVLFSDGRVETYGEANFRALLKQQKSES